jgi:hypothetical protein
VKKYFRIDVAGQYQRNDIIQGKVKNVEMIILGKNNLNNRYANYG